MLLLACKATFATLFWFLEDYLLTLNKTDLTMLQTILEDHNVALSDSNLPECITLLPAQNYSQINVPKNIQACLDLKC